MFLVSCFRLARRPPADFLNATRSRFSRYFLLSPFQIPGVTSQANSPLVRKISAIMPPKRKRSFKKLLMAEDQQTESITISTPTRIAALSRTVTTTTEIMQETVSLPQRRTSSRVKKAVSYTEPKETAIEGDESPLTELEDEEDELEKSSKKRKRRKKNSEPEVYVIPPVETKTTNFKGAFPLYLKLRGC